MDQDGQPKAESEAKRPPSVVDRRKYTRHRYSKDVEIHLEKPGSRYNQYDAVSFEVSEGGMSAATPNILFMGERVQLYPIMGFRVSAIVRRKHGAMYGFEFIELTDEQRETIREKCEELPVFTSMLDV